MFKNAWKLEKNYLKARLFFGSLSRTRFQSLAANRNPWKVHSGVKMFVFKTKNGLDFNLNNYLMYVFEKIIFWSINQILNI